MMKLKCVQDCIDMCKAAWKLGWHEYHAGNITYRLTEEEKQAVQKSTSDIQKWITLDVPVPGLAEEMFLVSASGSSFRMLDKYPEKLLGIIEIDEKGSAYRIVCGLVNGKPTSELPAHLMNHEVKKKADGDRCRIIYHAHPSNLISLSFVLPLTDMAFTRELWEMEPECAMTFPKGIGVLDWTTPGSKDSAIKTGEKMKDYDVVLWAYHGAFCAGTDFEQVFGLMHTVEKASEMLVKVLAMGGKRQHPTTSNFIELIEPFKLELPKRFLCEGRQ